jgi:guanine deaminase
LRRPWFRAKRRNLPVFGFSIRVNTPPPTDEIFLRAAIALAREGASTGLGGPFGAVVVLEGRIVGRGQNRVTSALDPTAHAEVVAIRTACASLRRFHLRGATLYTSCEPCPMCLAAAYWARIERIVCACKREDAASIGFDDALIYHELSLLPDARQIPLRVLLREEGVAVMRTWYDDPKRVPY